MLAGWIPSRRTEKVVERYRMIGGGSPLRMWTEAQAKAISQMLRERGDEREVVYAFRYSAPFIGEAISNLKRKGVPVTVYEGGKKVRKTLCTRCIRTMVKTAE